MPGQTEGAPSPISTTPYIRNGGRVSGDRVAAISDFDAAALEGRRLVTPDELAAYLSVALADDESAVTLGTRAPRGS
jgi:hypothetical protein